MIGSKQNPNIIIMAMWLNGVFFFFSFWSRKKGEMKKRRSVSEVKKNERKKGIREFQSCDGV